MREIQNYAVMTGSSIQVLRDNDERSALHIQNNGANDLFYQYSKDAEASNKSFKLTAGQTLITGALECAKSALYLFGTSGDVVVFFEASAEDRGARNA